MEKLSPSVSMVVPVFNEEALLEDFIKQSVADIKRLIPDFEIIAVDDGSTDNSLNILKKLSSKYKELLVVPLGNNNGIGFATIKGLEVARKSIVFWNTVDRVIDTAECLGKAIKEIGNGFDAVSFYRTNLKANTFYQKILTLGNKALIDFLFPWKFESYQQFQFHKTAFVHTVVFESSSTFIVPELLFKAHVSGLKIKQLETTYHHRRAGKAKGGRLKWVFASYCEILRIWILWRVLRRPMRFTNDTC